MRLISFLLLSLLAACSGRSSQVEDDLGAYNSLGGGRRDNDFSRFKPTAVTFLRPRSFKALSGGLLAPPLAVSWGRQALVLHDGAIALVQEDSLIWTYRFPPAEHPTAGLAADSTGLIYTVTTSGIVRAIDTSAKVRWESPVDAAADSSAITVYTTPLAFADGVIVGSSRGTIARLGSSGKQQWSSLRGAGITAMVAADRSIGVVAGLSHNEYGKSDTLLLLDPSNGTVRWAAPVAGARILSGPALVGDLIVVGAATRTQSGEHAPFVIAFTRDGKESWRTPLMVIPRGLAGDAEGNVYVSGSGVAREFAGGAVASFTSDGKPRWNALFESGIPASVAVGNRFIYFVSRREGKTGLFTYTTDGGFRAFISIDIFPDVLSQLSVSPFGAVQLCGLEQPVILEGDDS